MPRRILAFVFLACAAFAQDERRISSPNGEIEFRLFVTTQESNNLSRIAYEVFYRDKPLVTTSFLGLDIQDQEPLLGESLGLISSSSLKNGKYNSLVAKYMQNGSLGRLIDVEVRVYNDGVAFRYHIPPSTPLTQILIAEEDTEFRQTGKGPAVEIGESKSGSYPPMHLIHLDQGAMVTRLARSFQGSTPLTCPWRVIAIGPNLSSILAELN